MLTNSGLCRARCGTLLPYTAPALPGDGDAGLSVSLVLGGEEIPLLPHFGGNSGDFQWSFQVNRAEFRQKIRDFTVTITTAVSAAETGERRKIRIQAPAETGGELTWRFRFEPVLARESDYVNHPAFYRLGLHAETAPDALLLRRLKRSELAECWLCTRCSAPLEADLTPRGPRPAPAGGAWLSQPDAALSVPLTLAAGESRELALALCLGESREAALEGAARILSGGPETDSALPQVLAELLGLDGRDFDQAMALLPLLCFPPRMRPQAGPLSEGRDCLWRLGLSGDLPLVCFRLESPEQAETARSLIRRHALLSACGTAFDLVILTREGGSYRRDMADGLWQYLRELGLDSLADARGGVHLLEDGPEAAPALRCAAAVLPPDGLLPPAASEDQVIMSTSFQEKTPFLPKFKWDSDSSFVFYVNHSLPPRAWGNLLTNGRFGFFAADCGTGHLWFDNARELPLTPWLNRPAAAAGGETLELVTDSGRRSLFASPEDTDCTVRFAPGYARWEKTVDGLPVSVTAFVPPDADCRVLLVEYPGKAAVRWHTRLALGAGAGDAVARESNYVNQFFTARNPFSPHPELVFSARATTEPTAWTCDHYAWLSGKLDEKGGPGLLPCFAGEFPLEGAWVLVCGCDDYVNLSALCAPEAARAALEKTTAAWRDFLSPLQVETPEPWLDALLNTWAPYQAMACRYLGRSSLYQSGGAFGFRDQLQDIVNLLPLCPGETRRHILRCCAHQYTQGDVMHWWHALPAGDKGVRTRCSDDLLWLPWALCEYAEKTGDRSLLAERAPFLDSPPLAPEERDRYESPACSPEDGSVLNHGLRALELVWARGRGSHGLLHMGAGDWNDGFDRVGAGGKGESVWLSWFFSHTAQRFAALLPQEQAPAAEALRARAREAGLAAERAWDGAWYRRGFFDDGSVLGGADSACCRLDSVAQSFAFWSPYSDPAHRSLALDRAEELLLDRENRIARLFTPPFRDAAPDPGYVQSYGPGFRENGGQYTHGAVWLAMAMLRDGRTDKALDLLRILTPAGRDIGRYGAEPFVIAADVYAAPGHEGEAGWSWYTGSAGWFYRVCVEELLGLRLCAGRLFVDPRLPKGWPGFTARWRDGSGREHRIRVDGETVTVDGGPYDPATGVG